MSEMTPAQSTHLLRLSAYQDGYEDGCDSATPQRMVREFHEVERR